MDSFHFYKDLYEMEQIYKVLDGFVPFYKDLFHFYKDLYKMERIHKVLGSWPNTLWFLTTTI